MRKVTWLMCVGLLLVSLNAVAQSGPPKLCKPCLFYAGDLDGGVNANGFPNESMVSDPGTQTFGEIMIPEGRSILVEGILFQTLIGTNSQLDPDEVTWQIRTDNITDNGGTLVAYGGYPPVIQPTGRQFNGLIEYTFAVRVYPPVKLSGGPRHEMGYWINLEPQCTNDQNPACLYGGFEVSNTNYQTNALHGEAQVPGGTIINSPLRFYYWEPLCQIGYRGGALISFGVMGKAVQ